MDVHAWAPRRILARFENECNKDNLLNSLNKQDATFWYELLIFGRFL